MKKSLIWLLTIVMAITFGSLLYFQIMYLEKMVKMREEQFTEGVMRSLHATSAFLEKEETLHFLEQDVNIVESSIYVDYTGMNGNNRLKTQDINNEYNIDMTGTSSKKKSTADPHISSSKPQDVISRFQTMQEVLRQQYLYQKGMLNEVILQILSHAGHRPVIERADSTMIKNYLATELSNNGLKVPFVFSVTNANHNIIYSTSGYDESEDAEKYSITLFPNADSNYILNVEFPTKQNYIFSSVRFIIPTLGFTVILLIIFLYTIILAFRQKKITEMKTDFINNMTHELKTPISTISLAGQMLSDESIRKSPSSLKHLSQVIIDESKRLRFQVEKVLQLSVFDNTASALKFTLIDANSLIAGVVNTFKIKVEKFGGDINIDLKATDSTVKVDEMQFTNVISNLLDNAVKYRNEEVTPHLEIKTFNVNNNKLEIEVIDNGIGIKKDDQKRIFDKFYRVSTGNLHDVKGFGLGLAYVKKMITLFGGSITVESEFGVGSKFIIVLPVAK